MIQIKLERGGARAAGPHNWVRNGRCRMNPTTCARSVLRPPIQPGSYPVRMGGIGDRSGRFDEGDLSWTNEALPLELRRALLDKALDEFRSAKAAGKTRASDTPNRTAQTRAGPDSKRTKEKPQA